MDIVERLRREEARMLRLFDVASDFRDKHVGHSSCADFNAMRHAISGRDPVLEPAAAEIERLRQFEKDWQAMRDERDAARTGYDNLLDENRGLVKLEAENERLRTENQRLREALEPFASNFDHADGRQGWPDNSPAGGLNFPVITNGHLRRARAALSGKTEE